MASETLGDRLRKAKKAKGASNGAVAEAAGVSEVTVSRWLNDRTKPDPDQLDRAAAFLGVTSAYLRRGEEVASAHVSGAAQLAATATTVRGRGVRLPPAAYERLWGYLERLRAAGADDEQLDEAERIMADPRYAKLNKRTGRELTDEDWVGFVDAGWAAVWEASTRAGMKIPGPKPVFWEG